MSYRGMMDGWHGDEDMDCGFCGTCDATYYQKIDDAYEQWKDNMERSL